MATYNSTAISRKLPVPGFGAGGGQARWQQGTVTIATGATTTDTINLFYLPPNAKVLGILVKFPAFAGSTTLNIGDGGYGSVAADADRYFAAGSTASAGTSWPSRRLARSSRRVRASCW